jgi:tetratricopeptide (TPR) repeat protein
MSAPAAQIPAAKAPPPDTPAFPEDLQELVNLGYKLLHESKFQQALAFANEGIRRAPEVAICYSLAANAYLRIGEFRKATRHAFEASIRIKDRKLPAATIIGISQTLNLVGETHLSYETLSHIDENDPQNVGQLVPLGRQYSALEDQHSALRLFDKAEALGVDDPISNHMRGIVRSFTGPEKLAIEYCKKAIAAAPDYAFGTWSLSQHDQKEGAEERIANLHRMLARENLPVGDATYLHHALFREYDRRDETDLAWLHLARQAELRRSTYNYYDKARQDRIYQQIIDATSGDFMARAVPNPIPDQPIFILGMPRTGTTLLERILGNHPDVHTCGELNDFRAQVQWAADHRFGNGLDEKVGEIIRTINYPVVGQRYLQKTHWLHRGKPVFVDKHPNNFVWAGLILRAIPHARILNLRRHPMDSCFSNLKELFNADVYPYSNRLDELGAYYRNHWKLHHHWHAIAPGRILDVRYEDLVTRPDETAQRVLDYCGLRRVEGVTDILANKKPTTTASALQVRKPIHKKNVGGWKRYKRQLEPLRQQLKDLIELYEKG